MVDEQYFVINLFIFISRARHDYQDHVRNLAQGRVSSMDTEQRQKYRGGKSYRDQVLFVLLLCNAYEKLKYLNIDVAQ